MKRDLIRELEIPEGTTVDIDSSGKITVKADGKELARTFPLNRIELKVLENKLLISSKMASKRQSKMMGTISAHIKNMFSGVKEDFEYKLEVCNVHFPMNVKVDGNKLVIKSFLGEKRERIAKILPNTDVKINGSEITVKSFNIESAGQTAANIEKASKVTGRDRRIFQDGIFITQKCGRKI